MSEVYLYWGLGLLALSLALVVLEVLLPTAGVLGALSVVVAFAGVICLFRHDWRWGAAGMLAVVVLGPMAMLFGIQLLPATPWGRRILNEAPPEQPDPTRDLTTLIGREAEAITDLRPGGFVRVSEGGPSRVPALSEVTFVKAGARVRITGADGMQVRVRPVA